MTTCPYILSGNVCPTARAASLKAGPTRGFGTASVLKKALATRRLNARLLAAGGTVTKGTRTTPRAAVLRDALRKESK